MAGVISFKILENSIAEALNIQEMSVEEAVIRASELFQIVRAYCKDASIDSYKENAAHNLDVIRDEIKGFEERNFIRWKSAFDHLEMILQIACELGEAHGKDVQERNSADNNVTMAALAHIFPKSLLIVQEIVCLLKGGFPDGALARWRSLHESSVTAMYIAKNGEKAALEYLLSLHFSARRAANQMNEHAERIGLSKFTVKELEEFDARCSEAERILGRAIKTDKDGEWPRITLHHKNFASIEKSVDMEHWRPWYKWASSYIHANHRPVKDYLGLKDSSVQINLVGPSNSGFVDPFQLTALTLAQLLETYLHHAINLDRIVHIDVFHDLANRMGDIAVETEQLTRQMFEKTHGN